MGDTTNIEWADHTWSPWIGCTKISPACDGCYAAHLMDTRLGRVEWGPHGERRRTSKSYWRRLAAWDADARRAERMATVFPSLCDPFDNAVGVDLRLEWFVEIRAYPNLLWLLLTKRPQNIVRMVKEVGFMPPNIAFGTTCEDRKRVETNLPHLMVAAGLRPKFLFMSAEPLLEDLGDLTPWLGGDANTSEGRFERGIKIGDDGWPVLPALGQVITGGETDQGAHKARPSRYDWYRNVRDQCAAHGTPYLHKQNGVWVEIPKYRLGDPGEIVWPDGAVGRGNANEHGGAGVLMRRVGKKAAGRLLDGVNHDGFPVVPARPASLAPPQTAGAIP
ncbi:DUF5131 family protein [Beijerinckia sp. L45]|uniref:DUF5131 family protein n=1 Tax=Beijerinckia sp. L45 TaxID=1641855 RepID=UPI00131B1E10|nr:DUF5131 family protein [Beijerinckia sp. L45]